VTFVPNLLEFDDALSAMDIFCLPSLQQGIGTIMLEAMAMGRPVIATKVEASIAWFATMKTDCSFPPRNSEALAQRILELLDNPAHAREIGHAAVSK